MKVRSVPEPEIEETKKHEGDWRKKGGYREVALEMLPRKGEFRSCNSKKWGRA